MLAAGAFTVPPLFFLQLNATQNTGREMHNKDPRRTFACLCEYVDVRRLKRAHSTSVQCPLIFELHCVYRNISLSLMSA